MPWSWPATTRRGAVPRCDHRSGRRASPGPVCVSIEARERSRLKMQGDEKIQRRKLSDEVFNRLFQAIEDGDLAPGSQLPSERDLMARFGVGRPAVREAMQAL